jgi:hypothetical protein
MSEKTYKGHTQAEWLAWHGNRHNGSRHHDRHWQRQIERKAEANSGLGRQGCRANQGGREKQFDFHKFQFLMFLTEVVALAA